MIRNDEIEFAKLYLEHKSAVYTYLMYTVLDKAWVDDLSQEVFVLAWKKNILKTVPNEAHKAWLLRTATNMARNWERSRRIRDRVIAGSLDDQNSHVTDEPSDPMRVEDYVQDKLDAEITYRLLSEVSVMYRRCLVLHIIYGYDRSEVAEIVGLKPKSVSQYIARGRAQLTEAYYQHRATTVLTPSL